MDRTRFLAAPVLLAGLLMAGSAAHAAASIYVQVAPPPAPVEYAPPPRHGHIWVPGHWEWRHHQYTWVGGYYVRARAGYYYQSPQWVRHGERWAYNEGRWARGDRDHDGVPNRYDRDRDGDGIPNRYDRRPDNPYRR